MTTSDYSKALRLGTTSEAVHQALTRDIRNWWSANLVDHGDVFTVGFGDTRKTFKALIPPSAEPCFEIVWTCTEANLLHPSVSTPNEWVGTRIIWAVEPDDDGVKITLTHEGLNEDLQCFEICVGGWDFFFLESLKDYLETGTGKPFTAPRAA